MNEMIIEKNENVWKYVFIFFSQILNTWVFSWFLLPKINPPSYHLPFDVNWWFYHLVAYSGAICSLLILQEVNSEVKYYSVINQRGLTRDQHCPATRSPKASHRTLTSMSGEIKLLIWSHFIFLPASDRLGDLKTCMNQCLFLLLSSWNPSSSWRGFTYSFYLQYIWLRWVLYPWRYIKVPVV